MATEAGNEPASIKRETRLPGSGKLLILALDAANPALLRRWADDGTLPNIAGLIARGLLAETRSVDGLYVGATWPSFYTAHDPSDHGIYWLDRIRPGSYWTYQCRARDLAARPALWDVLSRAGRRVAVLDVPLTRISPELNGIQVVEWGVHDAAFGFRTSPRSLAREILATVGRHPAPANCDARRSSQDYRRLAVQLVRGAQARGRLTRELLDAQDWDFAIQVFSETHCAGHQLWHFHDTSHPAFDAMATAESGDLLRDVYVAVDAALGEIIAGVGADTAVVLLSLHGMSHACGGSLLLPGILERLEAAGAAPGGSPRRPTPAAGDSGGARTGLGGALRRVYSRLPRGLRDRTWRLRSTISRRLLRRETLLCPNSSAKSFVVGLGVGSTCSGIRLNLRGREPQGVLAPGAEAERYCAELEAGLLAITRPESSVPLVRRVIRSRERFAGPQAAILPDLLVEWEPEPPMGTSAAGSGGGAVWRAYSDAIGLIEKHNAYCRTGEHRIEGIMVGCGESIVPGRLDRSVSILDLAPTFARMLGCDMASRDGKVITELLGAVR